jgi:hypothetical protein
MSGRRRGKMWRRGGGGGREMEEEGEVESRIADPSRKQMSVSQTASHLIH